METLNNQLYRCLNTSFLTENTFADGNFADTKIISLAELETQLKKVRASIP